MRITSIIVLYLLIIIIENTQAQCITNADCKLNGECVKGGCNCDPGWGGAQCTYMSFQPAPAVGAYGYSPNVTAWGGVPVLSTEDNLYHLFVAEMVGNCGLCHWEFNSRVVHAVSETLLGPYNFSDVALGVWSHNPHIIVDKSSGIPVYLLFHIGAGDGGVSPIVCNSNSTVPKIEKKRKNYPVFHTSSSPYGPWTPQYPPGLDYGCNNPAPYIFPNGTIHLVCSPLWYTNDIGNVYRASSWKGPWTVGGLNYTGDAGDGIWEDPFIWVDKRGVFKMLAHVYPPTNSTAFWSRISGFAYSYDGFNWVLSPEEPYTNVVNHVNGLVAYTTRERPKIFFDPKDNVTPLALFTGVASSVPGCDCWDCKGVCGIDWTFNIVVPISP